MRVRLTVRYRTFVRTAGQVAFVVQSHVRDPATHGEMRLHAERFNKE